MDFNFESQRTKKFKASMKTTLDVLERSKCLREKLIREFDLKPGEIKSLEDWVKILWL